MLSPVPSLCELSLYAPSVCVVIICRCSILVCSAYVALGLGDPVSALSYAQQLLTTPQLPGGLQYLGKLYSAEALVLLEKVNDAMKLLNPESIGDIGVICE